MPWDSGNWDEGTWDDDPPPPPPAPPGALLSVPNLNPNSQSTMQYWEVTKNRAQETLPVWLQHLPAVTVGGKTPADLEGFIDFFEPKAQAQTAAQDAYDGAYRMGGDQLARMRKLGTSVPQIIEAQLAENTLIMKDVEDLYRTSPRTEATVLKRLRELLPVWVRSNAALAALNPPQAPITRAVGGTVYTAATAQALLDGYTEQVKTIKDKEELLDAARAALRALDAQTDDLIKRWYQLAKVQAEPGSALAAALEGITTEGGTAAPVAIEIDTLAQGGDSGLEVVVAYASGGGDHATTKLVKWKVEGVDADFTHSEPLTPAGNTIGPFVVAQVVKVMTEVSNSSGTRTSAVRTITIEPPV